MPLDEVDLSMNWTDVVVIPEGGSAIPIPDVTDVSVMRGSQQVVFYGGARNFPRLIKNVAKNRSVKISTKNIKACYGLVENTAYTVTAKLNDARNGTGSGCINVALTGGVLQGNSFSGSNNQFAGTELTFNAFANESDADPLSITITT